MDGAVLYFYNKPPVRREFTSDGKSLAFLRGPEEEIYTAVCIVADDGRVLKNRYGATNLYVVTKP